MSSAITREPSALQPTPTQLGGELRIERRPALVEHQRGVAQRADGDGRVALLPERLQLGERVVAQALRRDAIERMEQTIDW